MTEFNADRARRAIVEYTRRLADAATAAGPDAPVPTAPEWTVRDLVAHLGQSQHWAAEVVERHVSDPSGLPTEMAELPRDPADWPAWLAESARRVADACSDDAFDAPVWNAAADDRTGTRFWLDSALNEAVVHSVDATTAAGRPADIDPDVAAALVTNQFRMLTCATWEQQRPGSAHAIRGTGQTLQWRATDTGSGAWFVERRPDGATWRAATEKADVTVTGPAQSLLLALTRRIPLADADGVTVEGDATLVRHWLDNTAHVAG